MIVIYHDNCVDGFTAAWVARTVYPGATFVPAQYGQDPPNLVGQDVLIVDFSYPRETLLRMHASAKSIRVLDHHKSAQADLSELDFCLFDMDRSGAGLAWDELRGDGEPRLALVDYVEDRDLWRWKLPASREISAFIGSWEKSFERWSIVAEELETQRDRAVAEGGAILRALNGYVAHKVPLATIFQLGNYLVPVINTTHATSELVGKLSEGHPFAAGWFQDGAGSFIYSLRSRGDFDVSEVAKAFGGGGHRNAAGFKCNGMVHFKL